MITSNATMLTGNELSEDAVKSNSADQQPLKTYTIIKDERYDHIEFICTECNDVIVAKVAHLGLPVNCCKCGRMITVPESQFSSQVVIDDFVIVDKIATGGFGTIYKVYQRSLKRKCALKIVEKAFPSSEKLFDEAQMMALLVHQNIVQCYAVNQYNDFNYCAMEYINGQNLDEIISELQKISYLRAMNIIIQVVEALNYAWKEHSLTHNDITPANIIIDKHDRVKLSDLGLASVDQEQGNECFQGTPEFTSPENVIGKPVSFHSDMYSLGVVFYLCVTGKLPHTDENRLELMKKHVTEIPVNPKKYNHKLPTKLVQLIVKLMEKQPENRYRNYDELLEELDGLQLSYNREALSCSTSLTSKLLREHLTSISFSQATLAPKKYIAQDINVNNLKRQRLLVGLSINFTIIIIAMLIMIFVFFY